MKKPISIRWKILFYILAFSVVLFGLLWLFQTVFLDRFYENIRQNQIIRVASVISANIDDEENLETIMQKQAQDNEACIRVIYNYNQNISAGNQLGCKVDRLTQQEINDYIQLALNNNGTYLEKTYDKTTYQTIFGPITRQSSDTFDLIHTTVTWTVDPLTQDRNPALILVSARLTPVNATISTLKVQLGYIAGILMVMALILTWIMTYRIVKPLEKITDGAKVLATGNVDVQFSASGYKEVQELSDTLNYASSKLKEVDQMRRDLIANVSHDLRTPLTMISGYGEMMRDLPEENHAENAQVIIDEGRRLTALVNDLLDFSKLQAHQIVLKKDSFNITEMMQNTCQRYEPTLSKAQIQMIFEPTESLEVYADPSRIQQVLDNFINNAIHYGGSGKKIVLRQIDFSETVRIEVQDFGEGIPEDKLDSIWDRYYKIDKQHVRSETGSGIGLSIVKEILMLHGVNFGVCSKLQEGSTFYFELPHGKQKKK